MTGMTWPTSRAAMRVLWSVGIVENGCCENYGYCWIRNAKAKWEQEVTDLIQADQ
jgi:hypothetical protein